MPNCVSLPVRTETNNPWYERGLRFHCTQCGNCCSGAPGYVWITPADMANIAAFLGLPLEQFTRRYVRRIGERYSLVEKPDYYCIFLHRAVGQAMCSIYPVRPTQCRTWPFWKMNLESPAAWNRAAERCPGMADAAAPLQEVEIIERCRQHPDSP